MPHPLHEVVGELLSEFLMGTSCILVKDPACGGDQNIPLFCCDVRSNATEMCNVDLLVLLDQRIRVIVEIEEADVKPTQIAGKFLTSALASHFIHDRYGVVPKADENACVFLQFVDTSRLPVGSSKPMQWENLTRGIRALLPRGRLGEYHLLFGNGDEFADVRRQELHDLVLRACGIQRD